MADATSASETKRFKIPLELTVETVLGTVTCKFNSDMLATLGDLYDTPDALQAALQAVTQAMLVGSVHGLSAVYNEVAMSGTFSNPRIEAFGQSGPVLTVALAEPGDDTPWSSPAGAVPESSSTVSTIYDSLPGYVEPEPRSRAIGDIERRSLARRRLPRRSQGDR